MTGPAGGPRPITFVTSNAGKVAELQRLLGPGWSVQQDARGYPELQADTLAEVTASGAEHLLAQGLPTPFLLEDSGLFVEALAGFPGVYSRHTLETIGLSGLLRLLADVAAPHRRARFECDLLLVDEGGRRRVHFAGHGPGSLATQPAGSAGFGFDPLFVPDGQGPGEALTFAQMGPEAKNRLSHRGRAVRLLLAALDETAKP